MVFPDGNENNSLQNSTGKLDIPLQPIPKKSRIIKTDKPRPLLCPTCSRGFVRREHLKRHQRAHTKEKPFVCVFCGRCFARRDLIIRHQNKLHFDILNSSSSSSNNSTATVGSATNTIDPDEYIIKMNGNTLSVLPIPIQNDVTNVYSSLSSSLLNGARANLNGTITSSNGKLVKQNSGTNVFIMENNFTKSNKKKKYKIIPQKASDIVNKIGNKEPIFQNKILPLPLQYTSNVSNSNNTNIIDNNNNQPLTITNNDNNSNDNTNINTTTSNNTNNLVTAFNNTPNINNVIINSSNITGNSTATAPTTNNNNLNIEKNFNFFNESLRGLIITQNNLSQDLFPSAIQLNHYIDLYYRHFNNYYPFIHLFSINPSIENYPLLISLASLGSLYDKLQNNDYQILYKIAWLNIKNFLEITKNNHESTPLWVIQGIVLLTFVNIYTDEIKNTNLLQSKLFALIRLVKITKLNIPLNQFVMPPQLPPPNSNNLEDINDFFNYFVLSQSRIRTCHIILVMSNFLSTFFGWDCLLHSIDLKCGIPYVNDDIFNYDNSILWFKNLNASFFTDSSSFTDSKIHNLGNVLIDNHHYENGLRYLVNGIDDNLECKEFSTKFLLSLLISIHEKIYIERKKFNFKVINCLYDMDWRMNTRPLINSILKNWEKLFLKNNNGFSYSIHNDNQDLQLLIPLYWTAKIKECVDISFVLNKAISGDWQSMNLSLEELYLEWESLREATDIGLNLIQFNIDSVLIFLNKNNFNPIPKTFMTPAIYLISMFKTIFTISEYMLRVEKAVYNIHILPPVDPVFSSVSRIVWLKCEKIFSNVESLLVPNGYNIDNFNEFIDKPNKLKQFSFELLNDSLAEKAMSSDVDIDETVRLIVSFNMSIRCLYLGSIIIENMSQLPLSRFLSQALQARATFIARMKS
ncbi:hypothetical protein Kpol_1023p100 [Vanderwaltozyma polyspora DSM 70294]|uniref:C2H2-type domain-containing protein n=1 Tax=Vanderwaltozyma polyspora (strain ATCC 22028 / DSM 70294 / BCRC 21397 / CBS 2163 / NBRC 10782 / NRRL Y-8283 / UCD 57-17) TaxID=436907 RepID=A7TFW9_VANPO|nr:uncharacterized protein Kpol_1023p100 [Vanderwaltozyma polyspora DSM 70294]EDO18927.1 hypothetical protein Kpol_1023p100 [Vanderwaltozyma polyspora DSM 70294]